MGDWFVGKNHFFAVANTKESRKDEKYRCFLKNRDDDYFLGVSITPECNVLKTVEKVIELFIISSVTFYVQIVLSDHTVGGDFHKSFLYNRATFVSRLVFQ